MDGKRKLLEQGQRDVVKAGSLFLRAIFGDTDEFLESIEEETEETRAKHGALTVEGHEVREGKPRNGR